NAASSDVGAYGPVDDAGGAGPHPVPKRHATKTAKAKTPVERMRDRRSKTSAATASSGINGTRADSATRVWSPPHTLGPRVRAREAPASLRALTGPRCAPPIGPIARIPGGVHT